jgi:hypothetical protein
MKKVLFAAALFVASAIPAHADAVDSVIKVSATMLRAAQRCGDPNGAFENVAKRAFALPPIQDVFNNDRARYNADIKQGAYDFEGYVARGGLSHACAYVASHTNDDQQN